MHIRLREFLFVICNRIEPRILLPRRFRQRAALFRHKPYRRAFGMLHFLSHAQAKSILPRPTFNHDVIMKNGKRLDITFREGGIESPNDDNSNGTMLLQKQGQHDVASGMIFIKIPIERRVTFTAQTGWNLTYFSLVVKLLIAQLFKRARIKLIEQLRQNLLLFLIGRLFLGIH